MNNQTKTKNFTFRLGDIVFYTKIELIEVCGSFFQECFLLWPSLKRGEERRWETVTEKI